MPPPQTPLRSLAALRPSQSRRILNNAAPCLLCSAARHRPATTAPTLLRRRAPRSYATATSPPRPAPTATQPPPQPQPPQPAADARAELEQALLELNRHAANHVNLSRLQLALLGLRQAPGEESIRVAVVAVDGGGRGGPGDTAREVLRLLLADPLKGEEEWEGRLRGAARGAPVLVKVGGAREGGPAGAARGVIERKSMFEELHVSAPGFDGGGGSLEVLLMDAVPPAGPGAEEALLDLPVDIPSGGGRYTPIMTPVHKTLLVADGFAGIPSVSGLGPNEQHGVIFSAVNLPGYHPEAAEAAEAPAAPFLPVDVPLAARGVDVFRESLANGMEYERLWSRSRLPALSSWVKSGTAPQPGTTKPAVRALISSVLQNTLANLEASQAGTSSSSAAAAAAAPKQQPAITGAPRPAARLLEDWAQGAHAELQDRLDLAFTGRRWRQLNWWKLFWRADDVGALTSDIVSRDFLPAAERDLVYLAGQVSASSSSSVTYPQPAVGGGPGAGGEQRWPTHVSFARRYLQEETVPALQALAQRLVVKAAGTTGLTSSLAALLYASQWASSVYEAGAVAALGAVWSLWRLQGGWEAARGFWEGEVREEGRKAVRGAERSMAEALEGGYSGPPPRKGDGEEERRVRKIVGRARDALARLK